MKLYWELIKEKISNFVISNWQADGYYHKTKLIFIGIVIFFILVKILYAIF